MWIDPLQGDGSPRTKPDETWDIVAVRFAIGESPRAFISDDAQAVAKRHC